MGRSGFQQYEPGVRQQSVASAMNIQDPVSFPRIKKLHVPFDMRFYDTPEERIVERRGQWLSTGANICTQTAVALDAAIQAYERGAALKRHCDAKLREAEEKVSKIKLDADGTVTEEVIGKENDPPS